jgi:hypothetical protein
VLLPVRARPVLSTHAAAALASEADWARFWLWPRTAAELPLPLPLLPLPVVVVVVADAVVVVVQSLDCAPAPEARPVIPMARRRLSVRAPNTFRIVLLVRTVSPICSARPGR